jgi:hypothetical protein
VPQAIAVTSPPSAVFRLAYGFNRFRQKESRLGVDLSV